MGDERSKIIHVYVWKWIFHRTKFQWNFIAFEMDNEISLIMCDQCFFDVHMCILLWTTCTCTSVSVDHQLCIRYLYFWSYLTILIFIIFLTWGSVNSLVSSHHSSIFLKQCKIQIITIVYSIAGHVKHFDEISSLFNEFHRSNWDGWN